MKAIVLSNFGGVENLLTQEIPVPTLLANEVLVQVKAISINPVDAKIRKGLGMASKLKNENPIILGWDISGVITEVGKNVTTFKMGDEVFGMVNFPGHGKAYAEYIAAPAEQLAIKPMNISHVEAAAATLAALTAWQGLTKIAKLQAGQKILIHAAAGGVGHYAVQLAKHLGAYVIGTSSAANKDFVLNLGADEHIDYKTQPFETIVKDADIVLDSMGGDTIDLSLQTLKKGGIIVTLPSMYAEIVKEKAAAKGLNGCNFLVSSNGEDMRQLAELLEKGIIHSHVSQVFAFDEIAAAHLQIESGKTVGKIVVSL